MEQEQALQTTDRWQRPMLRNDVEGKRSGRVFTKYKYFVNFHTDT